MHIDPQSLKPIANLEGQTCFGCGATQSGGPAHAVPHRRYAGLPPCHRTLDHVRLDRTVHGGIISTMLDEIMGWSVIYSLKRIAVTKSITVRFKKPVQVETPLTLVGTIDGDGTGKEVRVIGELYSADEVSRPSPGGMPAALPPRRAIRLGVMQADYMGHFLPFLQQNDD